VHDEVAAKIIAAITGLCAFAIAVFTGLFVDNPADVILLRAIVALVVCGVIGFIVGSITTQQLNTVIMRSADQAKSAAAELEDVVSKATASPEVITVEEAVGEPSESSAMAR
jgi:uncharacterized membrane protein YraQ (UPF0718 family)